MPFRFRKTVKVGKGARLNLSKRGMSVSAGRRGATVNVGRRGTRGTVGLPGSGVSYSRRLGCALSTVVPLAAALAIGFSR